MLAWQLAMSASGSFPEGYREFGGRNPSEPGQVRYAVGGYSNLSTMWRGETSICLMESAAGQRLVSWAGGDWHGSWVFGDPGELSIHFDCLARAWCLKTTKVRREREAQWSGEDYRSRSVVIRWKTAWFYESGGAIWIIPHVVQTPLNTDTPPLLPNSLNDPGGAVTWLKDWEHPQACSDQSEVGQKRPRQ